MKHLWILVNILLVFVCVQDGVARTSSRIPLVLENCYRNNFTFNASPPLALPVLIELIRKVELSSENTFNMRILTTSMLHSIIFSGIRRDPTASRDNDIIIPFRASGEEFNKHRVLVDYLIPGQSTLFPADSLTLSELCFLHTLLSATVDPFERGDERVTCEDQTYMPLIERRSSTFSNCPLKKGTIKSKWGPISANQLISGISGGLQDNQVTFGRVVQSIHNDKSDNRELEKETFDTSNNDVKSIWVATLAGDLAGAILNQTTGDPVIGNGGNWNDTIYPEAFYLNSKTWDLTEPDILAGIDGAILGTYVRSWVNILDSVRLSQIIDMYYSERGISFGYQFRANNRSISFENLVQHVNLSQQIIGSAKLLQAEGNYIPLSEELIKTYVDTASKKLLTTANNIVSRYDKVEDVDPQNLMAPIELVVVLDGSYDYYRTHQMIYALADFIQVSDYGSLLGIINGQSGNWISNVTKSLFQIFVDLSDPKDEWPVNLSLSRSLHTIIWHYQNKSGIDCASSKIKPMGQAILVFSQDGRLTDGDVSSSKQALNSIKSSYPGTRVIFVTSGNDNSLKQLVQDENDSIVKVSSVDILAQATQVMETLNKFPANIVKFYCNSSQVVFEDYITPQISSYYEIHREYLKRGHFETKFINSDYGELTVCAFAATSTSKVCKGLAVHGEISFYSKDFCTEQSVCDLWFQVDANDTRIKCAESDCRYPDQIRMDIQYTYTATGSVFLSSILLVVLANLFVTSLF